MFEMGVSYRFRTSDAEYLAMKIHELLKNLGTSELDTVYFSEVVGSVGGVSIALYLSKSNLGVLIAASACDDESKCLTGPTREIVDVSRRLLNEVGDMIEVVKVEYVVRARLALRTTSRNLVKQLKIGGVEVQDGGAYDAGWYSVKTYKGKYMVSMKRLDLVVTLIQEKTGGVISVQVSISRTLQGVTEPSEKEFVDCLKAVSHIIAHIVS
ncbi:MAG: hypothetical protein RMH84_05315 [Sulfolobales archaeon]|nr:hypothetical protein [Sulfolobales archaeon]MCX8209026.1 hypothetical protein [Sulfolobales archaeon]MDW8010994.1 hypothetical protein [Sulfolobales archaeon]